MSKCNWMFKVRCREYNDEDGTCKAGQTICEHILPDPAPVVTCPKCGNDLMQDFACGKAGWICKGVHCDWSQPDSAQRPPYPAPREGYHAGEYRCVIWSDEAWFPLDGTSVCAMGVDDKPFEPHWIAVKDAPVTDALDREIATEEYLNDSGRAAIIRRRKGEG